MVTVIAEHSVELSLLPEKANILDLGCRYFLFADHLHTLGHNVIAVDADKLEFTGKVGYHRCAIMGYHGLGMIVKDRDPQATRVIKRQPQTTYDQEIQTYTLKSFCEAVKIPFFDLIKLDIEGAEYEVIMSLTEPPATQISVEFHCHTGIYGMDAIKRMEEKLYSLGYFAAQHEATKQHGLGLNFWDSLFILK